MENNAHIFADKIQKKSNPKSMIFTTGKIHFLHSHNQVTWEHGKFRHPSHDGSQTTGTSGNFHEWTTRIDIYRGKPLVSCCTFTITFFFHHIHVQIMIPGLI